MIKKTIVRKLFIGVLISSLFCTVGLLVSFFTDFVYQPKAGMYANLFWIASIIVWIFFVFKSSQHGSESKLNLGKKGVIILCTLVISAVLLRIYHLDFYAVFLDDWYWLDHARKISQGLITTPFGFIGDQPSNLPAFFVFPVYFLTGGNYLSVRITGILLSILSMLLIFFLARAFFNKIVAFFTIFFITTSIWDIHVSKIPWINTTINPLLITGSLYFFYKSLVNKSLKDSLLAGIFIGLSINLLYVAAVHVLSLFIFSIIFLVFDKFKKTTLLTLCLVGFTTFLVCSPTFVKIIKYPASSISRHEDFINKNVHNSEINGGLLYYSTQFVSASFRFVSNYANYQNHSYPYWGITIEPIIQVLFAIGLIYLIFHIKNRKSQLLLISFLVLFIPTVILERGVSEWREYGFFNHIYLFAGIGIWVLFVASKKLLLFAYAPAKLILILFTVAYLFLFFSHFKKYEKGYITSSLYPYENQCREVADYLLKDIEKSRTVYIPNEMCLQLISAKIWKSFKYSAYNNPQELLSLNQKSSKSIIIKLNSPNASLQVLGTQDIKSYIGSSFKEHILPKSKAIILKN